MIETDTKGIDALLGEDSDKVRLDWFEELKESLGVDPDAGWPIDTSFDEWPPPPESLPMAVLMQEITTALYQRDHSHRVVEGERRLVEAMHRLTREAEDAEKRAGDDAGAPAGVAPVDPVEADGGGGGVPGGPENCVAVGEGGKAGKQKNSRGPQKIRGGRRAAASGASG